MQKSDFDKIFSGKGYDFEPGFAVDFHCHILPKMDDGAKSIGASLLLIKRAVEQNVGCIVFTPHFYATNESPQSFITRRDASVSALKQFINSKYPVFFIGAEVQYYEGITEMDNLNLLKIGNTSLLLIEMPFMKWSHRVLDDILQLNSFSDTNVVIAHFERYIDYQPNGTLAYLRDNGILIQSNAEFLIDSKTRRKALEYFDRGQIDFIGSDCHNPNERNVNIGPAYAILQDEFGYSAVADISKNALKYLYKQAH